jgi:hypothetical protein
VCVCVCVCECVCNTHFDRGGSSKGISRVATDGYAKGTWAYGFPANSPQVVLRELQRRLTSNLDTGIADTNSSSNLFK